MIRSESSILRIKTTILNAEKEPKCAQTRENTYHSDTPCRPDVQIIRVFAHQNDARVKSVGP